MEVFCRWFLMRNFTQKSKLKSKALDMGFAASNTQLALATHYTISKPFTGVPIVTSIRHLTNHLWYYSACSGQILFVERSVPQEHKRGHPARPQAQVSILHPQLPGQGTAAQRSGTRRQGAPPHHGNPQASQEWDHPAAKAAAL